MGGLPSAVRSNTGIAANLCVRTTVLPLAVPAGLATGREQVSSDSTPTAGLSPSTGFSPTGNDATGPRPAPSVDQSNDMNQLTTAGDEGLHVAAAGRQEETSPLPAPQMVAATLDHFRFGLEDESRAVTSRLDEAAIRFVIDALEQLGFAWHVGAEFTDQQLHRQIPEPNRPKVARVLSRLVERGLLDTSKLAFTV